MEGPSATQLDLLATLVSESGRRSTVQLAGSFAYQEGARPKLKELVGMGSVALKLYLTLVMATRREPHALYRGTSAARFARTLGFDDGDWQIGLVVQKIVGAFLDSPAVQPAANDDSAGWDSNSFTHL